MIKIKGGIFRWHDLLVENSKESTKFPRTHMCNQYGHEIQYEYTQINCIFMYLQWTTGHWN